MNPWALGMLGVTILTISLVDIWTRYVPPVVIYLLSGVILIGWTFGLWALSPTGGLLVFVAAYLVRLPMGDVFGLGLCGLLTGPLPTMTALVLASAGLLAYLALFGQRWSLVQHPFFPYVGTLVLIFSITLSR